mgnify:FL=1
MEEFWKFAKGIVGAVGYCHADLYRFLMDPDEDELEPDPEDGSKFIITPEKEKELQAKYCVNHNDLHSNNIMRRFYDGRYILLDFGLAIQGDRCVKSSSRADGAYEYSSPEKLDGKEITAASDVYSLGILLYEILTGRVPFVMGHGNGMADISRIYDQQLHETPAPIGPLRQKVFEETHPGEKYIRDYPEGLDEVIMKCLEKRPEDRYKNAKEMLQAILSVSSCQETKDHLLIETLRAENADLRKRLSEMQNDARKTPVIAARSEQPLRRLREIRQEDFELLSEPSKEWYHDNCFILPAGSRLPSSEEVSRIRSSILLPEDVWTANDSENACGEKYFIAIKDI